MANRFSNITTAGFKGLSLDEIMAVPLAKQARQDASLAATDELEALETKRLEGDAGVVDAELERIRKESEQISKDLMDRGVDRGLSNKLRKLRSSQKKSFGASGVVGQAKANYTSAQKYINDLATKKISQAGWSPQEAKVWATKQVSDFGSSFDELGNFKQFSGTGLSTKVGTNDWINKNLKLVQADASQDAMKYTGNLDQFTQAYASGIIKERDFNKIMSSLTTMASNDPDLQASLKQQQFFDPNAGDARNIGKWEVRYRADGTKKDVFIPGNQFGRQLFGAAAGGQSREQSLKYHFNTDTAAKELHERGLDAREAADLVRAANGVLTTVTPDNIDEIKENTGLALNELERQTSENNAFWGTDEQMLDPNFDKAKKDEFEARRKSNPVAFEQAKKELNDSKVKYHKLNNLINRVETKALEGFTDEEKKEYEFAEQISELRTQDEATKVDYLEKELIKLGVNPDDLDITGEGRVLNNKTGNYNIVPVNKSDELLRHYLDKKNITNRFVGNELDPRGAWESFDDIKSRANDLVRKHLESSQNLYSESYTEFSALNNGKYSSKIGGLNEVLSDGFKGSGYSEAYSGKDMFSYLSETYPPDPSTGEAKVDYDVRVTDGHDEKGYPIEHLVVKDKNGSVIEVKTITRGDLGKSTQLSAGKELAVSSDPGLAAKGRKMIASAEYMPKIKASEIRSGNIEGTVQGKNIKIKGVETQISWVKAQVGSRDVWRIKVGEFQSRELFGEADMATYLYEELVKDLKKQNGGNTE